MNVSIYVSALFMVFAMVIVAPHVEWPSARVLSLVCAGVSLLFYVIGLRR